MIDNLTNYVPLTMDDLDNDADFQRLYHNLLEFGDESEFNDLSPRNRDKLLSLMDRYTAGKQAMVEFAVVIPA